MNQVQHPSNFSFADNIKGSPSMGSMSPSGKIEARNHIRSYFSDEDDNKSDEDVKEDILTLAEKSDKLKASRNDLMIRIASQHNTISFAKETGVDSNLVHKRSSSDQSQEPSFAIINQLQNQNNNHSDEINKEDLRENSDKTPTEYGQMYYSGGDSSDEVDEIDEKVAGENGVSRIPNSLDYYIKQETTVKGRGGETATQPEVAELRFKNPFKLQNGTNIVPPLPTMEGYLKKKSTNVLHRWQKRYFELKNRKLYYYKTAEKDLMSGCVDFDLLSVKFEPGKDLRHFKIIPVGSQREFYLKAKTDELGQKWFEAMKKHIEASRGFKTEIQKTSTVKRFWKYDRMSEDRFLDQADTGDILLFKTKNIGAKIQRSFTRSEYDHVGLILRYSSGEIILFEATGKIGVGLCRWKTFMLSKWYLLYSRIVYRKLMIPKTDEVIGGIEKFVRNSLGKKYKVSAKKILRKKTITQEDESEENETFFCSELVAACYKKIGLLPNDVSSASYLPGTFAAEKKLELNNGAKLGEEILIDFNI